MWKEIVLALAWHHSLQLPWSEASDVIGSLAADEHSKYRVRLELISTSPSNRRLWLSDRVYFNVTIDTNWPQRWRPHQQKQAIRCTEGRHGYSRANTTFITWSPLPIPCLFFSEHDRPRQLLRWIASHKSVQPSRLRGYVPVLHLPFSGRSNDLIRETDRTACSRNSTDLGSGDSPLYGVLSFDALYSLLLVINLPFDFGLIQAVDNWILSCLYVNWCILSKAEKVTGTK